MACRDPCWEFMSNLGKAWLIVHSASATRIPDPVRTSAPNVVRATTTTSTTARASSSTGSRPVAQSNQTASGRTRQGDATGTRLKVRVRTSRSSPTKSSPSKAAIQENNEADGNGDMTSSEVLMAMGMASDDQTSLLDRKDGDDALEEMTINPDELLSPLSRLQKYVHSEIIFNRQVVAKSLLDTLRSVAGNPEQVDAVFAVIAQLSNDSEPSVRAELMEQLAPIASFCREQNGHCPAKLTSIVTVYVVPIIVRYLTDINNQVRKAAQSALLVMLEQQLVDPGQLERDICPLVLQLTETDNMDDHRTEAVVLMSKMAPLVGQELTKKLFLERFSNLCQDNSFHVRKVCASHFGEFCAVVGLEATEDILLPKFYLLCEDNVWGVRRSCAEVFMPVSCVCSMSVRMSDLAPLFVHLLCDQSRWVKIAAFQALGPFISTFADPSNTGLFYSQDGVLVLDEQIAQASYREDELCVQGLLPDPQPSESPPTATITEEEEGKTPASHDEPQAPTTTDPLRVVTDSPVAPDEWMDLQEDNFFLKEEDGLSLEEHRAIHYATSIARLESSDEDADPDQTLDSAVQSSEECATGNSGADMPNQRTERSSSFVVHSSGEGRIHVHMDNETAYNAFQYWRMPLPELELDIDIMGSNQASVFVRARVPDSQSGQVYSSNMSFKLTSHQNNNNNNGLFLLQPEVGSVVHSMRNMQLKEGQDQSNGHRSGESQMHVESSCLSSVMDPQMARVLDSSYNQACLTFMQGELQGIKKHHSALYDYDQFLQNQVNSNIHFSGKSHLSPSDQGIVPSELLEQYLSMTDSTQAHMIDTEIARYCAYSFPAVALTLGRRHWPCLRRTFEILASDLQWKVRRTLASSMHELALILGCDLASQDLLPVFVGFLGDLDEVRIGILQHLALFLKLLRPSERREFLPQVTRFLKIDNERNWRFRLALAEQLIEMVDIYSPSDVRQFLVPLALALVRDRVWQVRQVALRVLAVLLRRVGKSSEPSLLKELLGELAEQLTHAPKWSNRQTFAFLCELVMEECSLSAEQFARDLLPHLLFLGWDKVPNVRMAVSRCLATRVLPHEYFSSVSSPHHELLIEALQTLQKDGDRDVRYYASLACDLSSVQSEEQATNREQEHASSNQDQPAKEQQEEEEEEAAAEPCPEEISQEPEEHKHQANCVVSSEEEQKEELVETSVEEGLQQDSPKS